VLRSREIFVLFTITEFDCDSVHVPHTVPTTAIQIYLKTTNGSFFPGNLTPRSQLIILAWNACPPDNIKTATCLKSTDWGLFDPYNTKMTISKRRASTVFSRSNFSIIDVFDLSDPSPVDYTAEDFFAFYEIIFKLASSHPDLTLTPFTFLLSIVGYLLMNQGEPIGDAINVQLLRLQESLACPLVIFNNAYLKDLMLDTGTSLSLAVPSYRVQHLFTFCFDRAYAVDNTTLYSLHLCNRWVVLFGMVFDYLIGVLSRFVAKNNLVSGNGYLGKKRWKRPPRFIVLALSITLRLGSIFEWVRLV